MKRLGFLLAPFFFAGAVCAQGLLGFPPGTFDNVAARAPASSGPSGWCGLVPSQGTLTNCWPFDTANTSGSTATDVIGGKNATLTSVTLNGSGPSTNLNNAGVFNGTSSTGLTTLSNVNPTAFTLNLWIWLNGVAIGPRIMANCHTDSDNNGFQIAQLGTTQFYLGNGSSSVSPANLIPATTWTMLTATFSSTTLTMYLNGSSVGTTSFTGPVSSCASNIGFGYNPAYNGDFLPGQLAGAALWNTALTSGQITTLFGL